MAKKIEKSEIAEKTGKAKAAVKRSPSRENLKLMEIELQIYREIGGLTVSGADRNLILSRLMDYALQALETDSGTVYLLDEEKGELVFEVVKGPLAKKLKGMRMKADHGVVGKVAMTGKPYISSDLSKDKFWTGLNSERQYEQKNIMAVPLKLGKKVIGVIQLINKAKGSPFTDIDLKVLKSLANHFSIILERANLFGELDWKLKQFSMLQEIGSLLSSTLDQRTVRRLAIEAITRLMNAETGSLLLVDKERGQLYFEVALGKGEKLKEVRLNIGEGIAGWVAKHGKPLLIDDVTKDKRFQANFDKRSTFTTKNMVCVPVKVKGNVIGVMQAINKKKGGNFQKDDLKLFELLANQVAIALDNARLYEEIKETFYATSEALAEAIEKRDPYTGGHTKRVLLFSLATAGHMDMTDEEKEILKLSAVLHDIGKIGIEDSILRKCAPLDSAEAAVMKTHTKVGADILKHVPQLSAVLPGMLYHHEKYDGTGYPDRLKGDEIPLFAKIIAVADTFDAMTTTRPYRKGLPVEVALAELRKCSGTQFDAEVVKAFIKAYENGEIQVEQPAESPAGFAPVPAGVC